MPRIYEDRINQRDFSTESKQTAKSQVVARPVDTYVKPAQDPLFNLVDALSTIQPTLKQYQDEANRKEELLGEQGAMRGESTEGKSSHWISGHMRVSGRVKGMEDAATLLEKFNTEFDKDSGVKASDWLKQEYAKLTQGNTDVDFLESYQKAFEPLYAKLDQEHHNYIVNKVTATGESNVMSLMDGGIRAYTNVGQPVPVEYLDEMRKYAGAELGVSNSRFNDLVFETIKRIGDEGNYQIYETLKEKKPDGTPGMYFIPEWKAKIDAAQIHSYKVFDQKRTAAEEAAVKEREERQETSMFEVLMEPDAKARVSKFNDLVASGLVTRASDLVRLQKLLYESVDGKPDPVQMDNEVSLITKIYQRKTNFREIINANLTGTQRKYLLNELEQAKRFDKSLAAQAGADSQAIYKTPEFRQGEDFIKSMLRPRKKDDTDLFGVGSEIDQNIQATGLLMYQRLAARVTDPMELLKIREDVTNTMLKRREDLDKSANAQPAAGRYVYGSLQELKANAYKLDPEMYRQNLNYLKSLNKAK